MGELNQLQQKLSQSMVMIKEAIDISANIKAANGDRGNMVTTTWESFLKEFLAHIKEKSNQTGHNLMAGVSWHRIKP